MLFRSHLSVSKKKPMDVAKNVATPSAKLVYKSFLAQPCAWSVKRRKNGANFARQATYLEQRLTCCVVSLDGRCLNKDMGFNILRR